MNEKSMTREELESELFLYVEQEEDVFQAYVFLLDILKKQDKSLLVEQIKSSELSEKRKLDMIDYVLYGVV